MTIFAAMKYIDVNRLTPNSLNPRRITIRQIEKLSKSLEDNPEYFEARPIICDAQYTVWAGHARLKAAKHLGLQDVPVHILDLPQEKMKEIMIRDNISNGDWDTNILTTFWDDDLSLIGHFGLEFKSVGWGDENTDDPQEDAGKKSKKPKERKIIACPHCKKEIEL